MLDGTAIVCMGIGMVALAVILIIISFAYRNTAGKRIREELMEEYK